MSENSINKKSAFPKLLSFLTVMICATIMLIFVYGLVKVSFQAGENSSRITQIVAYKVGIIALKQQPSEEQMFIINQLLRFSAHIILFAMLGYMLGIFLFMINRKPITRILSVLLNLVITLVLSYYTEYFKQFIPDRHFQLEDVRANIFGSLAGILFMLVSYILFEFIHYLGRRKTK